MNLRRKNWQFSKLRNYHITKNIETQNVESQKIENENLESQQNRNH